MTQIQAIEENAIAYYKGITRFLGGQFNEQDRVTWFTTGRRSVFRFNGVVRTALNTRELDGVVDPILDFFLSRNLPFFWVDWPDAGTPGLGDYLSSKTISFIHVNGMPVMSRALDDLPPSSLPKDVEIIRVQTQQDQADWLDVIMKGFEEPEPARPDIQLYLIKSLVEPKPIFEHFLAHWQGEPCATSTLLRTDQAAGIYSVTTLPSYRGHGLGRAMTLTALQSARKAGYSTSILFSTPSGFPVYKRLRFETVSSADLFIWNGEA